jgi:hypothetical protein
MARRLSEDNVRRRFCEVSTQGRQDPDRSGQRIVMSLWPDAGLLDGPIDVNLELSSQR